LALLSIARGFNAKPPPREPTSSTDPSSPDTTQSCPAIRHCGARRGSPLSSPLEGLADRYRLAYALQRDGMPPLTTFANWIKIIVWLEEAEATGSS
jgi:hypothetical protein